MCIYKYICLYLCIFVYLLGAVWDTTVDKTSTAERQARAHAGQQCQRRSFTMVNKWSDQPNVPAQRFRRNAKACHTVVLGMVSVGICQPGRSFFHGFTESGHEQVGRSAGTLVIVSVQNSGHPDSSSVRRS